MLQSGIKQAARRARSKKAKHCFMYNVSLPLGQQVAVMFQIVCTLTLAALAAAGGVTDLHGVCPDVLLSSEPWGHADHTGITCRCRSSDRTGAYIHVIAAACGDPADPRPSLLCARTIPATECSPALLRDTADCSMANVAPVTYPYIADPSPADFAPVTLRNSADPSPAHGFNRQYLTGSAQRPSDLIASTRSLSAQVGLSTSLVQTLSQPASSNLEELIAEGPLTDVSAPALSTGGQLMRPARSRSCRAGLVLMAGCS